MCHTSHELFSSYFSNKSIFFLKGNILPRIILWQKVEFMTKCYIFHKIIPAIFLAMKIEFVVKSDILPLKK